jgi:hypothetical protein
VTLTLFDPATATALAQILPVLLLSLIVELRRTGLHRSGRRYSRLVVGLGFGAFATVETVLVLSIDGRLLPPRPSDLAAGVIVFALLWVLFAMSRRESADERDGMPPSAELRARDQALGHGSDGRE